VNPGRATPPRGRDAIAADERDLLALRAEFPILERTVYMISNSLGAMPRAARESLAEYAEAWATRGVRAWEEGWWEMAVGLGDRIGALIGAPPGSVGMHTNVTSAQMALLSCFDFRGPRRKVVMIDMEFPSIQYLYDAHRAAGAEITIVRSEDGVTIPTERLLDAIDRETLLVPISHVLFESAYRLDAAAVAARAREVGAFVVLDVFQSAGTLPVDVGALGVDAAVGACLKWLCGGPGAAFLYVRPDRAEGLAPRFTGWIAHESPFAFEPPPTRRRGGAWRFLNGTPAVPALYAARPGIDIVSRVGIERIRAKSIRQTRLALDEAVALGLPVRTPLRDEERGGTVCVNAPNAFAVSRELLKRQYIVDYRPRAGIRLSPHFYSTDDEVLATVREIRAIADAIGQG
jgi:kynureninase